MRRVSESSLVAFFVKTGRRPSCIQGPELCPVGDVKVVPFTSADEKSARTLFIIGGSKHAECLRMYFGYLCRGVYSMTLAAAPHVDASRQG